LWQDCGNVDKMDTLTETIRIDRFRFGGDWSAMWSPRVGHSVSSSLIAAFSVFPFPAWERE
jgi:hypothetical protein